MSFLLKSAVFKYLSGPKVQFRIKAICCKTVARADINVCFIDGRELALDYDNTVDGCHPTDYGLKCMADRLIKELEKIIE